MTGRARRRRRWWSVALASPLLVGAAVFLAVASPTAAVVCKYAANCYLHPFQPWRIVTGPPPRDVGAGLAELPPGFAERVIARGFEAPTSFALLPDGSAIVAEKAGRLRLVREGSAANAPILDIRSRVDRHGTRGLVSVAVPPNFEETRLVYVLYSVGDGTASEEYRPRSVRLSTFRYANGRIDPASERIVLGAEGTAGGCPTRARDCIPADGGHVGGGIEFPGDGTILVSTGDGWSGELPADPRSVRAQRLDSLAGKLLRVDEHGRGLPSNPFWNGDPDAPRSKVLAYGLRNPFRFTTLPDGRAVVGDVGWKEWDEIDVVTAGDNLGWPCYEGEHRVSEYAEHVVCRRLYERGPGAVRQPITAYPAASITGGAFLADDLPDPYRGAYLFGDWLTHRMHFLPREAVARAEPVEPREFGGPTGGVVQFRRGTDGSLVYLALNVGELRRITFTRTPD